MAEQVTKQDLRDIWESIKELRECGTDHTAELASLNAKLDGLGDDIKGLSKILRDGNGKPSLIERVRILEHVSDSRGEASKDARLGNRALVMVMLSAALSAVGAFIVKSMLDQ